MSKNRSGTYLLGVLVALQVFSMPGLVDSAPMLSLATRVLHGYIGFTVILLWFAARHARPLRFRPRFWTSGNVATLLLLGIATWAAWRVNCGRFEISAAAVLLVTALAHLYRSNTGKPDCVQKSHPPA